MSENVKLEAQVPLRRSRMPAWSEIVAADGWIRIGVLAGLVVVAYFGEIERSVEPGRSRTGRTAG